MMFLPVFGSNRGGGLSSHNDDRFRPGIVVNPGTTYTPTWDGNIIGLEINNGSTTTINQPSNSPTTEFAECVIVICCKNSPCIIKTGTWQATDGIIADIHLLPGESKFYYFYYVNNMWTTVGYAALDDERVGSPPSLLGLPTNSKLIDCLNAIAALLGSSSGSTSGVSSLVVDGVSATGNVALLGTNGIDVSADEDSINYSIDPNTLPAVTKVTAGGVTSQASHINVVGINGITASMANDGTLSIGKQSSSSSGTTVTTTTTVPALVHSSAPMLSATNDVPVLLSQSAIVLGEFISVGDVQLVTIDGRIDYTSGSSKNPVWIVDVNGTTTTLTGPSLSASTNGRRWILQGYLVRKDATKLMSYWHLRLSITGGTYDAAGDWSSTTTSPGGHYIMVGNEATVSDWKAATFNSSASWSADGGETKALVVEAITIERMGRDSDAAYNGPLLLGSGILTGDFTGNTSENTLSLDTIPANTLDKDGTIVELLVACRLNSTSTTPNVTFIGAWNGVNNTPALSLNIGNTGATNYRIGLLSVRVRRLSSSSALITTRYIFGASGLVGTMGSRGASYEVSGDVITNVDWGVSNTIGLVGSLTSTTGAPHLLTNWKHVRRYSNELGRGAPNIPANSVNVTVADFIIGANTFSANGNKSILTTIGSISASGTGYATYTLTINGVAYSFGQYISTSLSSVEAVFTIQRVSATQIRVVGYNFFDARCNMKAQTLQTFNLAQQLTVKLDVKLATSSSITIETVNLSMVGAGGETITTTTTIGSAFTNLALNSATPTVQVDRELFRTQNSNPTTITNFTCTGLYESYKFLLFINDNNTTINNGTNIKTKASGVRAKYDFFEVMCVDPAVPVWVAMLQDNT